MAAHCSWLHCTQSGCYYTVAICVQITITAAHHCGYAVYDAVHLSAYGDKGQHMTSGAA
jgi:hypothetical protein